MNTNLLLISFASFGFIVFDGSPCTLWAVDCHEECVFDFKDCEEAERIAKRLDIKFHVVDFVKEIIGILFVINGNQIGQL